MKILDSHVHFWDPGALRYPWIEKGSPFDRIYAPEDYRRAAGNMPDAAIIFIEADADSSCSLREAQWAHGLASGSLGIRGIVARVPLTENPALLADLDTVASMPLVKGIRDNIQGHAAGFCTQAAFVRGVQEAGRRGLHFEICGKHHQLEEILSLARRCPEVSLVLDHCAKPDIRHAMREPWLSQIRRLAALPNIVCKISGLATEADWARWQPEDLLWYARQAADAFGPERILFGSDWPVCEVAGGFAKWLVVAGALADSWSPGEREGFFFRNAERVYRLGKAP